MVLGSGIRDPGSGKNLFRIPDPGVKKHPIPDPDPQHWLMLRFADSESGPFLTVDPGSGICFLQIPDPKPILLIA
jgi:hypothetical protein